MRRAVLASVVVLCAAGGFALTRRTAVTPVCDATSPRPSGRLAIANQGSGSVTVVELSSGQATHVPVGGEPHGIAASPDGHWAVVADYGTRAGGAPPGGEFDGNRLVVIDLHTKAIVRTIGTGEHRGVHDVAFIPGRSDRVVVTAQRSREVIEVDVERGSVVAAIPTTADGTHSLAISPDGTRIFTSNEEGRSISVLDRARGAVVTKVPQRDRPLGIAIARDELWVGAKNGVRVLDPRDGTERASMLGVGDPDDIAVSGTGRIGMMAAGGAGLFVVDLRSRRVLANPDERALAVAVGEGDRIGFATVKEKQGALALDLERGCVIARYDTGETPDKLAWAPENTAVAEREVPVFAFGEGSTITDTLPPELDSLAAWGDYLSGARPVAHAFDADGDGVPEYLVRANTSQCGQFGGCPTRFFTRTRDGAFIDVLGGLHKVVYVTNARMNGWPVLWVSIGGRDGGVFRMTYGGAGYIMADTLRLNRDVTEWSFEEIERDSLVRVMRAAPYR